MSLVSMPSRIKRYLSYNVRADNQDVREFLAEFMGTLMLCVIGNGGVTMTKLTKSETATFVNCFSYGVGVLIGVALSARISGAHINPAVTLGFAVLGRFPWKKVINYMVAQYLGAFVSSAVVYMVYYEAFDHFDGGERIAYGHPNATGGVFATYPAEYVSITGALVDEVIGTAILLLAVLAITDERGMNAPRTLTPLYLCFTITGICGAYSVNTGAIFNPARDLGPRLFTLLAGWGTKTFEPLDWNYWWIAGVIGPHIGAVLGSWFFILTIGLHNPMTDEDDTKDQDCNCTHCALTQSEDVELGFKTN